MHRMLGVGAVFMTRLDMVRVAIDELGEAADAAAIVRFVADRFRTEVAAKFVPVYLATLRAEGELRRARERAATVAEGTG
jgi:hypothetical protein